VSETIEEWRAVVGTNGAHEVSDLGRVRSWINTRRVRQNTATGIKPWANNHGYMVWDSRLTGQRKTLIVHTSVATAFLGPRPPNMGVGHLDSDKSNNQLDNLLWGTALEQAQDKVAPAGTDPVGVRNPQAKLTEQDVLEIRASCSEYPTALARRYGVCRETVRLIINRESWVHV